MRKHRSTWSLALLTGVAVILLSGCMGGEPGTGTDPKSEIKNIKSALKKSGKTEDTTRRIDLLRKTYDTADALDTRWPDAPEIAPFLTENKKQLDAIPQTVYSLALEAKDMESFQWALDHSAEIDTQYMSLVRFWKLGPKWQALILAKYPEQAMPVFMEQALESLDRDFFNAHAEAFQVRGNNLSNLTATTEFNVRYCGFLAHELERAMRRDDAERIGFLLDHVPSRKAAPVINPDTEAALRSVGDYLFYTLKDETLAAQLVDLRYPLNRIDLEKAGFTPEFMDLLKADMDYGIRLLQLDKWHGPLNKPNTLFLLSLPPAQLAKVDKTYIKDTIELCLSRSKTTLAMRLITFLEKSERMTLADCEELVAWAVRNGNKEIFEYIYKENDGMDIYDIDLVVLAANYRMFTQYAPRILTHRTNEEAQSTNVTYSVAEMISDVVASTNHSAGAFLIQKYDLDKSWESKEEGRTLLMEVCEAGNLPAAKYLIERKRADIQATTPFSGLEMGLFGRSDPVEGRLSPIHFAAKSGNAALIKYLASKKANVNARTCYGVTPLMYAASAGHLDATRMLILLKANVNARMNSEFSGQYMPEDGSFEQLSNAYRRADHGKHSELLFLLKKAGARP